MQQINLHRNSQKRFVDKDFVYFITTVTQGRFPFFQEDLFCDLFIENLKLCKKLKKFKLFGFVVLPDHVHLLIQPGDESNISKVMQSIKRHVSREINFLIEGEANEGGIRESRLHEGVYSEFVDIIKIHDEEVNAIKNSFKNKYYNFVNNFPHFSWQESFHDHVIRSEEDFFNHLNYIYFNCVKHNLCADPEKYRWLFSNREFACFVDGYFD